MPPTLPKFFGIQSNDHSKYLKIYTKRSNHKNWLPEGSQVVTWYICSTLEFKLYPEDLKKIMWDGIDPVYTAIHSVYISGKFCKCGEQYFRGCDKIDQFQTLFENSAKSAYMSGMLRNINRVYGCVNRIYPILHEFFQVFRVQFEL